MSPEYHCDFVDGENVQEFVRDLRANQGVMYRDIKITWVVVGGGITAAIEWFK